MKKSAAHWCIAGIMLLFAHVAQAQAILPTSWDFDTPIPEGWTEAIGNTGNTRYPNGAIGQACRLDNTGEYILIEFAEEPGLLTYWLKGQNSGGAWQGTFTIQESSNGTNWSELRSFTNNMPTPSFTQYTDQPAATSRYIRFFYTLKVSGHNVGLDEVALNVPVAGPEQEINVTLAGNNVPSGFQVSVGNAPSTQITIENQGLVETLLINGITLSGPHAAQFAVSSIPTTIAAQSSEAFTLEFNPVGEGSRFCTITIDNNDVSEGQYVINVYAVSGQFATAPTAQAMNLTFPNLVSWDFNVNFSAGNPAAEKYLVLRRVGAPIAQVPQNGNTYVRGEYLGDAQVVYLGPAGQFNARAVEVSTSYHFAVFAVNGPAGYENYLTTSPLVGSVNTPAPNIGNYYNGVDHNSSQFVGQVIQSMNPSNYFQVFYSNYISTLINNFYVQDTAIADVSMNMVRCQYSGAPYTYIAGFQFWNGQGPGTISREHMYPRSWMPTVFNPGFEDSQEVSDMHNLIPVLQIECNEIRSNYPLGEVVTPTYEFLTTRIGNNSIGQRVYEPQNKIKGDAARGILYQASKYHTTQNDFSLPEQISLIVPYGQNEYILKKWHFEDLPDNMERARNEYIRTQQNNRNAFIDSVHFPCFIRFSNMTLWQPEVIVNGDDLTAIDPALSYQWYLNGEEIDGSTEATLTAMEDGNYSVEVKQFDACPSFRSEENEVVVGSVSIPDTNPFEMSIYPNPSDGQSWLRLLSASRGIAQVRVYDSTGRVILEKTDAVQFGEQFIPLDMTGASGFFVVSVRIGETIRSMRLVVN